jgi:CheY-like chemotaxis protein
MNVCATLPIPVDKLGQARPSILCVDDSPDILDICRTMLQADGYQVFTANSGPDALQFLKLHPVDAVVIDNIMPGMNGVDLAREIKRLAGNVLVVMYSSSLREDERFPFVDSCLSKGTGPIALRRLLDSLLRK